MIVCLCNGVPERVVDETIRQGASSVEAIGLACGAGMGCGACQCTLAQKLSAAGAGCVHRGGAGVTVQLPLDAVGPQV